MVEIIKFGQHGVEVKIDNSHDGGKDLWLDSEKISKLYERDYANITRHIKKIYQDGEVGDDSYRIIQVVTEKNGKKYKTEKKEYNLDVILSVGYKVNGKVGTKFRKWANEVLGKYLVQGYVVNEKVMLDKGMKEMVGLLNSAKNTLKEKKDGYNNELDEVFEILEKYGESFSSLQNFDTDNFTIPGSQKEVKYRLNYDDAIKYIDVFKNHLIEKGEATIMFGKEKEKGALDRILASIFGGHSGGDYHEYLEEKAANLLYAIIKDHPFLDGNKRTASFLFVTFLKKNDFLYHKNGKVKISDEALIFLTVMIAQSQPKEKNVMVKMLINTIRGGR